MPIVSVVHVVVQTVSLPPRVCQAATNTKLPSYPTTHLPNSPNVPPHMSSLCPSARTCGQNVSVTVEGLKVLGTTATTTCFSNLDLSAANTPSDPTAVSPSPPVKAVWEGVLSMPANSFCIVQFGGQGQ